MTAEEEEINNELHELWLQDYENWKHIKSRDRRKSIKRFWVLFIQYAIILSVGMLTILLSQFPFSILAIVFYILAAVLCSIIFIVAFNYNDKELHPGPPPPPKRYKWENGELKIETSQE